MNKLHSFVNRCFRCILNIRWPDRISNNSLWEITKQEPIDTIEKDVLDWNPLGARRRRPRKTWRTTEGEIIEMGKIWR
jgi:hypothetical protein